MNFVFDRLQRLMKIAANAYQVQHVLQESSECWYHPSFKVLMLGEAAHLLNVSVKQHNVVLYHSYLSLI